MLFFFSTQNCSYCLAVGASVTDCIAFAFTKSNGVIDFGIIFAVFRLCWPFFVRPLHSTVFVGALALLAFCAFRAGRLGVHGVRSCAHRRQAAGSDLVSIDSTFCERAGTHISINYQRPHKIVTLPLSPPMRTQFHSSILHRAGKGSAKSNCFVR